MALRTDLAIECAEMQNLKDMDGVCVKEKRVFSLSVTDVLISAKAASHHIGKPMGRYITFALDNIDYHCIELEKEVCYISDILKSMIPNKGTVLIAGLGNVNITPDALGVLAAKGCIATRHLNSDLGFRSVAKIIPDVLGNTGIESTETIKSVIEKISPDALIVIDALAAKNTDRLIKTIQITNTGISPGSGVKNCRPEISEHTVGVPVVAIGVPTVTDGITIAESVTKEKISSPCGSEAEMIVTTRDIDKDIKKISAVISAIINKALQTDFSVTDLYILSLE